MKKFRFRKFYKKLTTARAVFAICALIVTIIAFPALVSATIVGGAFKIAGILILGPNVTDMFNKTGNNVRSHNHYGLYERVRAIPKNPKSVLQQMVRGLIKTFSQEWRVAVPNIEDWNAYAATVSFQKRGRTIFLTGEALYVKLNSLITLVGGTSIATIPANVSVPIITSLTATTNADVPNVMTIETIIVGTLTNWKAFISATPALSAGTTYGKKFKNIGFANAVTGTPMDVLSKYNTWFNPLVVGDIDKSLFYKVKLVNSVTGQETPEIMVKTIIVATP